MTSMVTSYILVSLVTVCIGSNLDPFLNPSCLQTTKCERLQTTNCLGASLPYTHTSVTLANDSKSQAEALEKLHLWSGLRLVPHCWDVVQPLLCAVYLPSCDANSSQIILPSRELCLRTREPCRVVETSVGWPEFLQCDQEHFPPGCTSETVQSLRFNTSGECQSPLVATDNINSWYEGVEGCGLQCQNPLFTPEQHREVHIFVGVLAAVCLICTLFTILTFVIDWKNAARYPALILFFINTCFFIGSIGWLAQFIPGARNDIVCRRDGTIRKAEPQIGSGETASCSVVFILVYYSMMSAITWFVILAYTWHLTFRVLGTTRDAIEGKKGHFHVAAWCVPLVLTIVCLAVTQVDGDSVSGICFVGYMDHAYRGGLVLAPVGGAVLIGLTFLFKGLIHLCRIRYETPGLISQKASAKIRETMIRLGVFSTLALVFTLIALCVHVYIFVMEKAWYEAFEEYIVCEAKKSVSIALTNVTSVCEMESRPSLVAMEMNILAFFGAGITMSSWVWNGSTCDSWKRFFRKIFRKPVNEPVKMRRDQRHRNRHKVVHNNRVSLSLQSIHDDPLGMKLDLQSITTNEMSSMWAIAVPPRFLGRRGPHSHYHTRQRRHSESDVTSIQSFHQTFNHHASFESRWETSEVEEVPVRKKKKKKKIMKNKVAPLNTSVSSLGNHHSVNHKIFTVQASLENENYHPFGVQPEVVFTPVQPFSLESNEAVNIPHRMPIKRSLRKLHGSDRSLESNPSYGSAQVSLERPPSSEHSFGSRFNKRGSGSSFEHSSIGGHFVSVNHTSHYSVYSANVPSNIIGLTDIEDPSSCFSTEITEPLPPKCYKAPVRSIFVKPIKDIHADFSFNSSQSGSESQKSHGLDSQSANGSHKSHGLVSQLSGSGSFKANGVHHSQSRHSPHRIHAWEPSNQSNTGSLKSSNGLHSSQSGYSSHKTQAWAPSTQSDVASHKSSNGLHTNQSGYSSHKTHAWAPSSQSDVGSHKSRSPRTKSKSKKIKPRHAQSKRSEHSPCRSRSQHGQYEPDEIDLQRINVKKKLRHVMSPPPISAAASWRMPSAPPEIESDWITQD